MADNNGSDEPVLRNDHHHHADKYGTKFVNKTEKYQKKVDHATQGASSEKKGPAGGYDSTPIPKGPPGYTLRITFHRAENLPFADLPSFSSDPYILAILQTDLQKRHKQDADLQLRTPTVHRNTNPKWDAVWTVAHVPSSGFHMKCRIYDEDPADHDDRLGNVHVDVGRIDETWKGFKERKFEVKKRMGSKRAYTLSGCAALLSRGGKVGGEVYISVENLGRSDGEGGRAYTISPLSWSQHFSPLIGLITGTKNKRMGKDGKKATERHNFQAIQIQLQGPVPEHLYHRYVEFRPFVAGMFTSHSLRGRILNHALHHQHARVYNYDGSTKYGQYDKPCVEMTKQFLDFVNYDQGGRIFTYVITLDGQWRFTETGKEFGIDMLSKHTMHSDVNIYIAFSGEFFVRRLKQPHKDTSASPDPGAETMPPAPEDEPEPKTKEKAPEQTVTKPDRHETLAPPADHRVSGHDSKSGKPTNSRHQSFNSWRQRSHSATSSTHSPAPHAEQTSAADEPPTDPSYYELIIDNDSGTYRPNAKYLGQLKKFLQHSLPGLRVATLDCQKDEEKMSKLKDEQRERKKKSGNQVMYMQNTSMSSISSSEEEELERRASAEGNSAEGGIVKTKWNKAKKLAGGEKSGPDSGNNDNGVASASKQSKPGEKSSMSTAEKASFDTASEHGDGHFVTPKPSIGNSGLNASEKEDRPLSRGIDEELERRRLERLSHDGQDSVPDEKINGYLQGSTTGLGSVHQTVTSAG